MNRANLHPYQIRAIDFISEMKKCALFLDMGLGKTVITLTALSGMIAAGEILKVLIIAPLRVANSVWRQEVLKWAHLAHLRVAVATGPADVRKRALNSQADIYVINRENVVWMLKTMKGGWGFDAIVIDELSSVKNPSAKRFRALRKVTPRTPVVIGLTGTPSPNGLIDLWSQMFLIDNGKSLGKTVTGYRQRFFRSDYMGYNWEPRSGSGDKIKMLIKERVMSMRAKDYLDVPERIDIVERVTLKPTVLREYDKFENELFLEFGDGNDVEAISAAVLANKLLQFANGAIYTDESYNWEEIHTAKLDALADLLDDNAGENILVAYNYKHDLIRLRKRFPHGVTLGTNPRLIDLWNRGEVPLMFAHPASCGHGINLQDGGSMVIWFGLNWNLEYDLQMNARLHRQGQTRPVRVVRLVSTGTIDERVLAVLRMKDAVQKDLLKALRGEQWTQMKITL